MLLFSPDRASAKRLAGTLQQRYGYRVRVAESAADALQAIKRTRFRMLIVGADLNDRQCLRYLSRLRRAAPRSWLLVTTPPVNLRLELRARRRGVDAILDGGDDGRELGRRMGQLLLRSRPSY